MPHIKIGLTREQIECIRNAMIFESDQLPLKIDGENVEAKVSIVNITIFEERQSGNRD